MLMSNKKMPKLSLMNNRIPFGLPFPDLRILVIFIMSPRSYSYIILVENGHIQVRTPSVKFNHHCKSCLRRTLRSTPANGAGLDGFFGWVLIHVLLDGWKRVTL